MKGWFIYPDVRLNIIDDSFIHLVLANIKGELLSEYERLTSAKTDFA